MKMSYKIALIVSLAICILAIFIFNDKDQAETIPVVETSTNEAAAPEQRKTLKTGMPGDGSLKSMVDASTPATAIDEAGTLAEDARSRVLASLAADTPNGDAPQGDTSGSTDSQAKTTASPLGNGSSAAIALARTENGTSPKVTSTEPTTQVSNQALDTVFATSDRPDVPWPNKNSQADGSKGTVSDSQASSDSTETYVVQPGDTFSSIAIKLYNDERRWVDISQANFVDPTKLKVGQELRLPDAKQTLSKEEPSPPGPGGIQTYTIRTGDSLSTVAETYYGDPTLWRTIYNFNRDKIGENPNAIQAGMALKVPPRVQGAR
jgi:nucleoid-associated protein YgaU